MHSSHFTRSFLLIFSGPIIWVVHFLAIYGATGVICARPAAARLQWFGLHAADWCTLMASVVAMATIGAIVLRTRRQQAHAGHAGFTPWMAAGLGLLSIIAILWETLPILFIPACN
ncbi:hypothetical protein [Noviherbaspirillum sp. Root189]|uniref:hypothetical protein n=1 Tax=Noviherbaspirillum sp. Root189 TaxID=1736487 RepID=UPI000710B25A|nr:hypothetical protein [Noviherbaspirillum sp. Root189]KRB67958.1 hypothetical protein ASE07_09900 [Noviherbaspirillum sp. Root189]